LITFSANILKTALISRRNFDMSSENADESCQFLKLLLNDEVLSLTLNRLPILLEQEMECVADTLAIVSKECPDLQKLVCEEDPYDYLFEKDRNVYYYDDEECGNLGRILNCTLCFVKLQVLNIEKLECNDFSLCQLAEHLPQLR
jgi:hypothetical protein